MALFSCRDCHQTWRHAPNCPRRRLAGRHSVSVTDEVSVDHFPPELPYAEEVAEVVAAEITQEEFDRRSAEVRATPEYQEVYVAEKAFFEAAQRAEPQPAPEPYSAPSSYESSSSSYDSGSSSSSSSCGGGGGGE